PFDKLAQVHADVAARDRQASHDVVHRQGRPRQVQQAVDAGHGRADAPQRTHRPPQLDELVFDLFEASGEVGLGDFHRFYSFQEYLKLYQASQVAAAPAELAARATGATGGLSA